MQANDVLRVLRAYWQQIAIAAVLTMVAAGVLLPGKLPRSGDQLPFQGSSTLVLESGDDPGGTRAGANRAGPSRLNTLKVIASEGEVPAQVAGALGTTVPALLSRVTVTSTPTTSTLTITVRDRTADAAIKAADTYSKKLLGLLTSQAQDARTANQDSITKQVQKLEADKALLDATAQSDPAAKAEADAVTRQLSTQRSKLTALTAAPPVSPPLRSIGPPTVRRLATDRGVDRLLRLPVRLAIGGLLGFAGSLAAFSLIDRLNLRLRTKKAAELAFGLPVLAEVPLLPQNQSGTMLMASEPQGAYAEAHRMLRTSILSANPATVDRHPDERPPPCLIVVTSAEPSEGKTSTATNLAASFAEAGSDTLLVGLDLRHDDLHALIPPNAPSEDVHLPIKRAGEGSVRVSMRPSRVPGLRLVTVEAPVGPPVLVLPVVASWLREIRGQVDAIVIDTSPLLVCNDASELIPFADTVLIACRAGHTTAEAGARAAELLARLHAPVCGIALVGATLRPAARNVSTYGATPWVAAGGSSSEGWGDPARDVTPAPPALSPPPPEPSTPPWTVSPDRALDAESWAAPSSPDPVPDDERDSEHAPAARAQTPVPVPGERPVALRQPALPPEPPPSPSEPAGDTGWQSVPVPAPVATTHAPGRRTFDWALERITGRRNLRR